MFEALSKGFREAQNRLAGLTELSEKNLQPALREVRLSLLEADVELGVVKRFLARVEEKAREEALDHPQLHVGLEQRQAHFAERGLEVLLVQLGEPGEAVLCLAETFG